MLSMKHTRFVLALVVCLAVAGCDSGDNAPIEQTDLLNNVMGSTPFNTLISGQLGTPEEAGSFFKRQVFVTYTRPAFDEVPAQPTFEIRLQVFEDGTFFLPDSDVEQHEVYMQLPTEAVAPGVYDAETYNQRDSRDASTFFAIYQVQTGGQHALFYVRSGAVTLTDVTDDWVEGNFTFVADEAHIVTYAGSDPVDGEDPFERKVHTFDDPITFNAAFRAERRLSHLQDDSVFEAALNGASIMGRAKVANWQGMSQPTPFADKLFADSSFTHLSLRGFPELHPTNPELSLFAFADVGTLGPEPGTYSARTLFSVPQDAADIPDFMPTYLVQDPYGNLLAYTASSGFVMIQERTDEWLKGTFEIQFDGVIEVSYAEIQAIFENREQGDNPYLDPRDPTPLAEPLVISGSFSADRRFKLVQ